MLSFVGSVIHYINTDQDAKNTIMNAQLNKKLENQVFEPVIEKQKYLNDKNVKKRNEKINQRSYENRLRRILQNYFNTEFIKVRPEWLKNPITGRNLELDIYSPILNIAVEFNGQAHTQYLPYFHKSEQDFKNQVLRDQIKMRKTKDHGVKLIVINHWDVPHGNDVLDSDLLKIVLEKMSKII